MSENQSTSAFPPVGQDEAGQKLLRFLQRRLELPEALLHRWIRTGQIRLNGKRCKPFDLVGAGDQARIPPFACKAIARSAPEGKDSQDDCPLPYLLEKYGDIWAFAKPAGLSVQGGSSIDCSFGQMVATRYADRYFKPAPAHRLDKETSGILLVGATFAALKELQGWFRDRKIHKEYLAWVKGRWPYDKPITLRHHIGGLEKIEAREKPFGNSREAICHVRPVMPGQDKSLLQIHLVTGRKRQIRAQLAACGFPIIGDNRFGPAHSGQLKLHACRVILPDGKEFSCAPPWAGAFAVEKFPEVFCNFSL